MEIEHKHDTESVIDHSSELHVDASSSFEFNKLINTEQRDLKEQAFN